MFIGGNVITQHPYCHELLRYTVSQRVLLIKFKVVNYIFYSFYQNNAIGFNCLRSRFHCSTK